MSDPITIRQFGEAEGLDGWRVLSEGASTFFRTGSFADSARLLEAIGALPDVDSHPPAVDVRQDGITVRLVTATGDYFGMSRRDVEVAQQVTAVARAHGLAPDPAGVQSVLMIPGAPDIDAIMPFWRAVLGYVPRGDSPDEDLVDPADRGPAFWFEGMQETRPGGSGAIHVAVWVPVEQAEARVAAALDAGGRMVRDDFAPAWWTLADAAGNEADIATSQYRD
jgi:4a-hydroxytetrahydrobiopterin dehydratase